MDSAREHSTLYQPRNLTNRKNVINKPKSGFNTCDNFFEVIITAHILTAAIEALSMKSLGGTSEEIVHTPEIVWVGTGEERMENLEEIRMHITQSIINISFNESLIYQLVMVCMTLAGTYLVLVACTLKCKMQSKKVMAKVFYSI